MSRLTNYLESAKLAKLHLTEAEERWADNRPDKAIKHLCAAVRELITANNNLASIAFNAKPKRRQRT